MRVIVNYSIKKRRVCLLWSVYTERVKILFGLSTHFHRFHVIECDVYVLTPSFKVCLWGVILVSSVVLRRFLSFRNRRSSSFVRSRVVVQWMLLFCLSKRLNGKKWISAQCLVNTNILYSQATTFDFTTSSLKIFHTWLLPSGTGLFCWLILLEALFFPTLSTARLRSSRELACIKIPAMAPTSLGIILGGEWKGDTAPTTNVIKGEFRPFT